MSGELWFGALREGCCEGVNCGTEWFLEVCAGGILDVGLLRNIEVKWAR